MRRCNEPPNAHLLPARHAGAASVPDRDICGALLLYRIPMADRAMMSLYARLAGLAAICVALAAGAWKLDHNGYKRSQNERTAEMLVMSENARLKEKALNLSTERIEYEFQITKNQLALDKRATDERLRDFTAAVSADTTPSASDGDYGDPRSEILAECAGTAVVLDEAVKRMAGQTAALQRYTREVCLAK